VRAVRIACAEPEPWSLRGWLRRRWPVVVPLAIAAGVIAVVAVVRAADDHTATPTVAENPAPPLPAPTPVPAPPADDSVPVFLDGEAAELGALDDDAAAELDRELGDELAAIDDGMDDDLGGDSDLALPDDDLGWVDDLDDASAEALDAWLAEQPS